MRKLLLLISFVFALAFYSYGQVSYCNSNFTDVTYEYITNVNYAGINNASAGNTGGPVDYTSQIGFVTIGSPETLSVSIEADSGDYVYAFIDWNQDGDFNDPEEVYTVASGVSTNGPFTISITPPAFALGGTTRMRVMVHWNGTTPDPCVNATYGEAEDYTLSVSTTPATCLPGTNITKTASGITTTSLSWDASLSGPAGGYKYELRTSGAAGSGATGLVYSGLEAGLTHDFTGLTISTNYTFYLRAICGVGDSSVWIPYSFSTVLAQPRPWLEPFATNATPTGWNTTGWLIGANASIPGMDGNAIYREIYSTGTYSFSSVNVGTITTGDIFSFDYQFSNWNSPYASPASNSCSYVVAISTDFGTTYSDIATIINDGTDGWKTYTLDLSPYIGDYIKVKITATYIAGDYYVAFDNFAVQSCVPPTNLEVPSASLTATSATINWDASLSSPANGYTYELRTSGAAGSGATGLVDNGTLNLLTKSFTTLTSNTKYTFYIRSVCTAGDSSNWASKTFTTPCIAVTNFTENFDAVTTPNLPSCWAKVGSGGSLSTQASNPLSSPNCLYIYSSSSSSIAMVRMPEVSNADAGTHRLRFRARANATIGGVIQVGYLTDPADPNTFVQLGSDFVTTSTSVYDAFEVNPINAPTGVTTLVFKHTGVPAYSVLIDNVIYEAIPSCEEPTNVSLTNITSSGVDANWDAPLNGTPPLSYSIYYSTTNSTPSLTQAPSISGILGTTQTISGLTPATQYYIWVRSICTATDSSSWSFVKSFMTLCEAVNTYPYTEGFNTVGSLPACWSVYEGASGASYHWQSVAADATNGAGSPAEGAAFMRMYYYLASTTYNPYYLQSIPFNLGTTAKQAKFSIWMGSTSGSNNLKFEISTDGGNSWTALDTYSANPANTNSSAPWETKIVDLSAYVGETVVFRLNATSNYGSGYCDIGFDNFTVQDIPSCNEPTNVSIANITTTDADISWDAPLSGTPPLSYSIYYSTTNTTPSFTQAPNVSGITGLTTTITGLNPSTSYYIWVRSICTASDSSAWSNVKSFATACAEITTYPYTEGFNTVGSLPACWSVYEGASGASYHWQSVAADATNGAGSPAEGAAFMRMYYYLASTTYNPYYLQSIPFNLGTTAKQAKFSIWMGSTSGSNNLKFEISTDDGNSWTTLDTYSANPANNNSSAPWETKTVDLSAYVGETVVFRLNATSNYGSGYCDIGFDNFTVQNVPSCNEPTNVSIANITTTAADISWDAPLSGTPPLSYSIYYSTTNSTPSFTQAPNVSGITGLTTTIIGLNPSTSYYIWVRSICTAADSSAWSNTKSFATACDAVNVPYTENFNSTSGVALPNCTSTENAGSGNNWATAVSPGNYGFSSRVLQYTYNTSNAANAWFYTVPLNLTGGTTYTLSYKYGNNSTFYIEKMNVYYGTAAANASMTEFLADHPSINTANAATNTVDFTPATTGVYYIGFHVYSIANQYYLYVDDINVIEKVLPVTYTSFTGKKEGNVNLLTWQTATEINNTGFELQRSADNKNFSKLNFIASKANNGNSNAMLSYNYTDAKPLASSNYYRLKQIDRDGKANYSNTILLKGDNVKQVSIVAAYPNPARNILNVQIVAPAQERVSLVVTDITGKILQQETMVLNTGDNTKQIDVSRLTQGTYIIKTICSNGCESAVFKFTKN